MTVFIFQGANGSRTGNGNEYFQVPGHTPVIFSEVGGRTLYRYTLLITCADADFDIVMFDRRNKLIQIEPTSCIRLLARDAGGETEGVLLNETVPAWVVDIVVEKKLPKFIKVRII